MYDYSFQGYQKSNEQSILKLSEKLAQEAWFADFLL